MKLHSPFALFLLFFLFLSFQPVVGQTSLEGVVVDAQGGETVIGAQIRLRGQVGGTITDFDGKFSLPVEGEPPYVLQVSSAGFEAVEFWVNEWPQPPLEIVLTPVIDLLNEVVISASRIEENLLFSTSGVDKINLAEWQTLPSADVFAGLALAKGVQLNAGSYAFPSLNTRGFADAQNWRFLHFIDGMELTSPGLGYSLGNNSGPGELDIRYVEITPGPGSALYGPNAFNGILSMQSKSPFDYPGLSAVLKAGMTRQGEANLQPYTDMGIRFAQVINEQWAYKIMAGYQAFTDWTVDDDSYHITPTKIPFADQLLALPAGWPAFDAVSRFGDEVQVPVLAGPDSVITVNRTGIREQDILDYKSSSIKLGGALVFRPQEGMEATYDVRYFQGDAILRHTTVYPLRNIAHLMQKIELKGEDFNIRVYHSQEDANDSYALLGTGAFIQEGMKSSALWSQDYGLALRGEIPGINAGDHRAARLFADRDLADPGSETFQALREATLSNPNLLTGGSKFIEKSGFVHLDAVYDFTGKVTLFDLQEGISYRRYFLNSEGNLFNDGPLGFQGSIPVTEYGAFAQASKTWFDDRLTARISLRFDKNQNFEGRLSPRAALVFSPDAARQHVVRASAQTGFRSPSPQESYIALDIRDAIILGGTQDNIDNYNYSLSDGRVLNGRDIHQRLMSVPSVQAFLAGGGTNPGLLQPLRLDFLRQEQITTFELGYRGVFFKSLFVDLSAYANEYTDFVTRTLGYSLEAGRVFAVYTNVETPIQSYGTELMVEYHLRQGLRVKANYAFTQFDASEAEAANPGFLPGFNTPPHRASLWVADEDAVEGFGYSAALRWSDGYLWQSPFGQGNIESYFVVDAYVSYRIPEVKSVLKVGANNLLNQRYRTMYGGPEIGAQYYFSLTFDELFR